MEDFTQTLIARRDQAVEAAHAAGDKLIRLLKTDESNLAVMTAEALERRAYARWWTTLIDRIDDGTDPVTALTDARTTAHDALLILPTPRSDCPYSNAQAITAVEATRAFFYDTATLHPPIGNAPSGHVAPTTTL